MFNFKFKILVVVAVACSICAHENEHPRLLTPAGLDIDPAEQTTDYWVRQAQAKVQQKWQHSQQRNLNRARNIIMFLGDGMSVHTFNAARNLLGDTSQQVSFEKFPFMGLSRTYSVDKRTPDSACTATAYLSGVKANYATIGVTAAVKRSDCFAGLDNGTHTESIAKWAQEAGKWTGLVTTARVTHASPAGVYAHTPNRDWEYDKIIKAKCGASTKNVDIAEQLVHWPVGKNLRVILGGGRRNFRDEKFIDEEGLPGYRSDNRDLIKEWLEEKRTQKASPQYIWSKKELNSLNLEKTDYLLGLFSSSHCPYHGDLARDNLEDQVPSLTEMTQAAIKLLSKNKNGYFLFVEGAKIDMAHHETRAHKSLEDTLEFSRAIEMARNLTNEEDTLIVVTSDHSHTMTINGYPLRGQNIFGLAPNKGSDGLPFTILSYANGPGYTNTYSSTKGRRNLSQTDTLDPKYRFLATVPLDSETHGGDDVGVFASGPYEHYFTGSMEQSNIPALMAHAAQIGPFS